jgi:hypothetical protein
VGVSFADAQNIIYDEIEYFPNTVIISMPGRGAIRFDSFGDTVEDMPSLGGQKDLVDEVMYFPTEFQYLPRNAVALKSVDQVSDTLDDVVPPVPSPGVMPAPDIVPVP